MECGGLPPPLKAQAGLSTASYDEFSSVSQFKVEPGRLVGVHVETAKPDNRHDDPQPEESVLKVQS